VRNERDLVVLHNGLLQADIVRSTVTRTDHTDCPNPVEIAKLRRCTPENAVRRSRRTLNNLNG